MIYTDESKKKATNCCIRFGHSLWSAIQLLAQEIKELLGKKKKKLKSAKG